MADDKSQPVISINEITQKTQSIIKEQYMPEIIEEDELSFLDDIPADADDYEIEMFDGQDDEGCEGGACKIQ